MTLICNRSPTGAALHPFVLVARIDASEVRSQREIWFIEVDCFLMPLFEFSKSVFVKWQKKNALSGQAPGNLANSSFFWLPHRRSHSPPHTHLFLPHCRGSRNLEMLLEWKPDGKYDKPSSSIFIPLNFKRGPTVNLAKIAKTHRKIAKKENQCICVLL